MNGWQKKRKDKYSDSSFIPDSMKQADVQDRCEAFREEISKMVVGYEDIIDDFLICLVSGGHMLMVGVPGIAKTTLAEAFCTVSGLDFHRIQFTADILPADITGHYYFNQKKNEFELRKGPIFTQFLLADEINRAPSKTQSALIEAMQEGQVTIEGNTFPLPDPFFVVATKNPLETEGIYPLPEAQLDRFMLYIDMGYLGRENELEMLKRKNRSDFSTPNTMESDFVADLVEMEQEVYAEDSILSYISDIVWRTRTTEDLVLGASPRASEHLLYASKAYALINGRDYAIPDDVKRVVPNVLSHRIILSPEMEMEDVSKQKIIQDILDEVEVPKGS